MGGLGMRLSGNEAGSEGCGGLGMRLGVKGEYGGPGNEAGSEG